MRCNFCYTEEIEIEAYECPNCGAVLRTAPARRTKPTREVLTVVESENFNGIYTIYKNSDNSLSCNCLSFLFQRGTKNSAYPFTTCKHIRRYLEGNDYSIGTFQFVPPSEWQKVVFKKLGVKEHEHLTNTQAYFLIRDILRGQGINYLTMKDVLLADPKPSFIPLRYYGVEFEGGLGCAREEFKDLLEGNGLEAMVTGYDHTLHNCKWKVGFDRSVSPPRGLFPAEVVSPKLYGEVGFQEIRKVLSLWNQTLPFRNGSESERVDGVNITTGTHVHVDAKMFTRQQLFNLALVWAKIEVPVVFYLVSPSRRDGRYCRQLNREYLKNVFYGTHNERYFSLNLRAFEQYGSVEFRIHNGTLDPNKIIPWIIFCCKLVEAVENGLTHEKIEPNIISVLDAIGIKGTHPILLWARESLIARYEKFKAEAEAARLQYSSIDFDVDVMEELRRDLMRERRALTARDSSPNNSINNLAARRPSSVIMSGYEQMTGREWSVPSRAGERRYTVTLNPETDTLTCNCRGFRTHGHCYHSVNLARYLLTQREFARVETEQEVN